MIELKGTEKQIKWAEDIRKKFKNSVNILLDLTKTDDYKNWLYKRYDVTEEKELISLIENIEQNASSKFWIENRYTLENVQSEIEFATEINNGSPARIRGQVIRVIEELEKIK